MRMRKKRSDRLQNIRRILGIIMRNKKHFTGSQLSRITGLSPSTCCSIQQELHNNFSCYRYKKTKPVTIKTKKGCDKTDVEIKPITIIENLLNDIGEFVEKGTLRAWIRLKSKSMNLFRSIYNNWSKLPGVLKQKFVFWKRNTSREIISFFEQRVL